MSIDAVRARYAALAADLTATAARPPADPELSAAVAAVLHAEARMLDARAYAEWLALLADDAMVWVPLTGPFDRAAHPATDQSLFLDDRRRLDERVWRLRDPNAWALRPAPWIVRAVGAVEAWPEPADEVLAGATLGLQQVRTGRSWAAAGRTVHRLRRTPDGWRIVHKIIAVPALTVGAPNLGWLL